MAKDTFRLFPWQTRGKDGITACGLPTEAEMLDYIHASPNQEQAAREIEGYLANPMMFDLPGRTDPKGNRKPSFKSGRIHLK
ncbi:MAG: hypothetical protein WCQ50_16990 [Spirochaetota bacterium]